MKKKDYKVDFLNKMVCNILGIPTAIDDIIDIVNIKTVRNPVEKEEKLTLLEFSNEARNLFMFKRTEIFDNNSLNDKEFFERAKNFTKYLNKLKDEQISFTLRIDEVDKHLENYMLNNSEDNFHPFFKEWKKEKYNQIKKDKKIKVFAGVRKYNYNGNIDRLLKKMYFEPMKELEVFNYLYDVFNPDKRANNPMRPIPKNIAIKLKDPSVSLLRILYDSYIEDMNNYIAIGDYYLKVYKITMPGLDININKLIKDLLKVKGNILLNVHFKKSKSKSKLLSRRKLAKSSLLSSTSGINNFISENITKLLKFTEANHLALTECEITFVVYTKSFKDIEELEINFDEWSEAKVMFERYEGIEEYFRAAVPGLKNEVKNGVILSSLHQAELMLMSSYYEKDTTFIFHSPDKVLAKYPFFDPKKHVNSTLISAPTGSGKSVLLNYIYLNFFILFKDKLNSFIIDYGGSYKNLVEILNKNLKEKDKIVYLDLKPNNEEGLNIFDLEFGKEITDEMINTKVQLLVQFFKAAFNQNGLTNEEITLLDVALQETYKKFLFDNSYKKYDNTKSILEKEYYIDKYIKSGYTDVDSFLLAMPTINDLPFIISSTQSIRNSFEEETIRSLTQKISNFVKTSMTKVFTKPSKKLITNKHVIIDLKNVIAADRSYYLASLYFLYYATSRYQTFIGKDIKDERKLIFIDEYPQILKATPSVESFVDMLLKTGRKEKIDTFLIAQNVNSFHPDFYNNIGNLILFKPKTKAEVENVNKILALNEYFLKNLDEIESIKGKYSEFMVLNLRNDIEKSILRLVLNGFEKKYLTLG